MAQESLDQLKQQQRMLHTQSAVLDKTFEILGNFETLYDGLDFKTKRDLYNIVFKFAHAKCLGMRKPKFIDHYELNGHFPQVSMEGGDHIKRNASKLPCKNLDIQSLHTAGHWNLIVNQDTPQATDTERVEIMMQTYSLEAEKSVRVE